MKDTYTFQQKYIHRCNQLGKPLDKVQINALEEVVSDLFGKGVKFQQNVVLEQIDYSLLTKIAENHNYRLPTKVFRNIRKYRHRDGKSKGFEEPVTNSDAVALYNNATVVKNTRASNNHPFTGNRKELGLPNDFTQPVYDVLRDYLYVKGLITEDELLEKLSLRMSQLGFNQRTINALDSRGIYTVRDLLQYSSKELHKTRNLGLSSYNQIEAKVHELGFKVGQYEGILTEQTSIGEKRTPINQLGLTVRSRLLLMKLGVETAEELTTYTERDLLQHKHFGVSSLNDVKRALSTLGLSLRSLDA